MTPTILQMYVEGSKVPSKCSEMMKRMKVFAEKRGWGYRLETPALPDGFKDDYMGCSRYIQTLRLFLMSEEPGLIFVDWDAELFDNFEYKNDDKVHCDWIRYAPLSEKFPNDGVVYGSCKAINELIACGKERDDMPGRYVWGWPLKIMRWYKIGEEIPPDQYDHILITSRALFISYSENINITNTSNNFIQGGAV